MHVSIIGLVLATLTAAPAAIASEVAADVPLALRSDDPNLQWGPCPPVFPGECKIAVVHGDATQPNADVMLRVAPGYELPRHRHTSAERMILLEGELVVEYDGADATTLTASTYAYGPAGLPHTAKCISDDPCTLFIAFEGPVDAELVPAGV